MCELCRRRFIGGAAALGVAGAAGLFSSPLMAQARRGDTGASKLPARGEFTIANAHVMTMDSAPTEYSCASSRELMTLSFALR